MTWIVEGTDAALYITPPTNAFYANLSMYIISRNLLRTQSRSGAQKRVSVTREATHTTGEQAFASRGGLFHDSALPRSNIFFFIGTISVAVGDLAYTDVPVNKAIPFTITTPYPPETQISFAPYSTGFTFSPLQIGLGSGTTSASFTATPTQTGSQTIQWGVFGDDADKYTPLDTITFNVEQGSFTINYPSTCSHSTITDSLNSPFIDLMIRSL